MTATTESDPRRQFVHGMWASIADSWAANAEQIDERARPITDHLLQVLREGDRVLELACGPGGCGLAAATVVGNGGEVVLTDVVEGMVNTARDRAAARGLGNVRTAVRDLESIEEPDATFDVVLCREGLMFAIDPDAAVREMHRVLRAGGRIAVSVWGPRAENPWFAVLGDALEDAAGVTIPPPGAPGPFSLGDQRRFRGLFTAAGFVDVDFGTVTASLRVPSFDAWWQRNLTTGGPAVAALAALDDATRERVREAAARGAAPYEQDDGVLELPGLAFAVTARKP